MKKKLVVLTGAGISAESGIPTFRDSNGLWENHKVEDVATPEAWDRNPELVQRFYNERRKAVRQVQPNAAHTAIAKLEEKYDVTVVTQNIDDLHERGGSTNVVHLHGLITRSQSNADPQKTYPIVGDEIKMGELCELGTQLRPNVVWFGEQVPMITVAAEICHDADVFIVCGTSLVVYPAAGLVRYVRDHAKKYIVDLKIPTTSVTGFKKIKKKATEGIPKLVETLLSDKFIESLDKKD